jgi:hypothetical protein
LKVKELNDLKVVGRIPVGGVAARMSFGIHERE